MKGDRCERTQEEIFAQNNYAHSSMIGWLLTSHHNTNDHDVSDESKACTIGKSFTAFRCWKYGLISYFTALTTEIEDITSIECNHGVYILNS